VTKLIAGAIAVLLSSAALGFAALPAVADDPPSAPDPTQSPPSIPPPLDAGTAPPPVIPAQPPASTPPSARPEPVLTVTCTVLDVVVESAPGSGLEFDAATGRAEKGTPVFSMPAKSIAPRFEFGQTLDPGQATAYIFELRAADGTLLWSRSGTTVPCAPEPVLKFALPYRIQKVPACGKTLADVVFPSTPGIVYSHDEWNAYARLQPGWHWDTDAFIPPSPWWNTGTTTNSDLAVVPRSAFFTDMPGCPRYATVPAPTSQLPLSTTWKGPGAATLAAVGPAATTAPQQVAPATGAPGDGATPSVEPSPAATAAPSPTVSLTAYPSPAPTATAGAGPRVATTTGLGVASGVAGACVLSAAGAFVVRRRLHPSSGTVALDEPVGDEPVD
jgi:hypothetical protein